MFGFSQLQLPAFDQCQTITGKVPELSNSYIFHTFLNSHHSKYCNESLVVPQMEFIFVQCILAVWAVYWVVSQYQLSCHSTMVDGNIYFTKWLQSARVVVLAIKYASFRWKDETFPHMVRMVWLQIIRMNIPPMKVKESSSFTVAAALQAWNIRHIS